MAVRGADVVPGTEAEQEILALDDLWADSRVRGDAALYDGITESSFLGVNACGAVADKAQRLQEFDRVGDRTIDSIVSSERSVRIYGDTAVLVGRTTVAGHRDEQHFEGAYRYTHVFVRREGQWQAVSAHMCRLCG